MVSFAVKLQKMGMRFWDFPMRRRGSARIGSCRRGQ
jgi:hypothetical protein